MANNTVNYGFEFYKNLYTGGPAQTIECEALSTLNTAIFVGDTVKVEASGGSKGRTAVTQAVAGTVNTFGVVARIDTESPDDLVTYSGTAKTTRIVQVIPVLSGYLFRVKCNTAFDLVDVGAAFDLVLGTGDTKSGRSRSSIDPASTSQANIHIVGVDDRPDNVFGAAGTTALGVDVIVRFHKSVWIIAAAI